MPISGTGIDPGATVYFDATPAALVSDGTDLYARLPMSFGPGSLVNAVVVNPQGCQSQTPRMLTVVADDTHCGLLGIEGAAALFALSALRRVRRRTPR